MAIQTINIGTTANDGTGDDPRTAGDKINDNFTNSNHAASRDVGTAAGDVMEVGAFSLGLDTPEITDANSLAINGASFHKTGVSWTGSPTGVSSTSNQGYIAQFRHAAAFSHELFFSVIGGGEVRSRVQIGSWSSSRLFLTTGNTTVDGSGFIKEASPIVKLYSDKIELNDYEEIENCTFERVDTGHYIIKGAPLLSRDGWYIETLKDRNNNIYFTLDYEELEDGLHVKTYTPDYSTGRAINGAPVDINEGRFVTLRFEEDKAEE